MGRLLVLTLTNISSLIQVQSKQAPGLESKRVLVLTFSLKKQKKRKDRQKKTKITVRTHDLLTICDKAYSCII